jgi:hypothetical protein
MEFIGGILGGLFWILCFVGVCGVAGLGFRAGWLLADEFHNGPKED